MIDTRRGNVGVHRKNFAEGGMEIHMLKQMNILVAILAVGALLTPMAWGENPRVFTFENDAGLTTPYGQPDAGCSLNPIPPLFNYPGAAATTSAFIVSPMECGQGTLGGSLGNDALLTAVVAGTTSEELRFSWADPTNDESWVRVVTEKGTATLDTLFPNPTVYLGVGGKVSMKIALTSYPLSSTTPSSTGQLEFCLAIRETGRNLPLGADGGTTGALEFIGIDSVGVGGTPTTPVGGATLTSDPNWPPAWNTVSWEILSDTTIRVTVNGTSTDHSVVRFTGDGVLSADNSRGTLNSLVIRKAAIDDVSKQWFVNIDDLTIEAPAGVVDPVKVNEPIQDYLTEVTVSNIDATASRVTLYKNSVELAYQDTPFTTTTTHTFTGLTLTAGDVLTATQTVGGIESSASDPVNVVASGVIADFETGVTSAANGTDYGVWYQVRSNTYGSVAAVTMNGSPSMKVVDSGFGAGCYAVFQNAIRTTGKYHLEADCHVDETEAGQNGIRYWKMGVKVNGAFRTGDALDAIVAGQAGQAEASYAGLTSANNTSLPVQHIVSGNFDAVAGDNLLIAFSTNLSTWGNGDGTSSYWYDSAPIMDNIVLVSGASCSDVAVPKIETGPLVEGGTSVTVTNVDVSATNVAVYAGSNMIGEAAGNATNTVVVTLNEPLVAGQVISARQTVNETTSCEQVSGPVVGLGYNTPIQIAVGLRENTALTGPIGANGGTTGSGFEWIGVTALTGTSPTGAKGVAVSSEWQTITFTPSTAGGTDPVTGATTLGGTTSNGTLEGTFAVLEHVAIIPDTTVANTGGYTLYIDNVMNGDTVIANFEDGSNLFQHPRYSSTTSANILLGAYGVGVSSDQGDGGGQSEKLWWQLVDTAATRWLRVVTYNTGVPNPEVDLSKPITLRVLLVSSTPDEPTCNNVWADADNDTDVDQVDFGVFQKCITGALGDGAEALSADCACFDRDGDNDVDGADFMLFDACWSGPAVERVLTGDTDPCKGG